MACRGSPIALVGRLCPSDRTTAYKRAGRDLRPAPVSFDWRRWLRPQPQDRLSVAPHRLLADDPQVRLCPVMNGPIEGVACSSAAAGTLPCYAVATCASGAPASCQTAWTSPCCAVATCVSGAPASCQTAWTSPCCAVATCVSGAPVSHQTAWTWLSCAGGISTS